MPDIKTVLMTVIALFALIGGFSWAVSLQLAPVKSDIARIERHFGAEIKEVKHKLDRLLSK